MAHGLPSSQTTNPWPSLSARRSPEHERHPHLFLFIYIFLKVWNEGKLHGSRLPGVTTPLHVLPTILGKRKNSLTQRKNKTLGWLRPAPSQPSLWLISRTPCPSHLRENYSQQPWRRTGHLKTSFLLHKCSSSLIWLLPPLIKGDLLL